MSNKKLVVDTIQKGSIVVQSFNFVNTGLQAVSILSSTKSCGCTELEIPSDYVKPNDSVLVSMRIDTKDKNLGYHKSSATLKTDGQRTFYYLQAPYFLVEKE